jgi:hypothetical protein
MVDRLFHARASIAAISVGAAIIMGGSCSCPDRVIGEPPEGLTEPACLWLISPYAFRADGSVRLIVDEENDRSPTACLCITQDEYDALGDRLERVGFPEEGTLLDEFNEVAYDECKRLAALIEGAVDDECLDYYENGTWLKDIYFSSGAWANGTPSGFTCYE